MPLETGLPGGFKPETRRQRQTDTRSFSAVVNEDRVIVLSQEYFGFPETYP
jgi:hypothetical protein